MKLEVGFKVKKILKVSGTEECLKSLNTALSEYTGTFKVSSKDPSLK